MLLITARLTSGQITFILRTIIQLLSYGGLFLIGLLILGNSPRSALKETHDVLNRIVGKSTATSSTIKWMTNRILKKRDDPMPSKSLLFVLLLSTLYGLFVALSDVGFLGLSECTVPYPTFDASPASIRNEAEARTLIGKSLINGTDPKSVQFHQCESASDVFINENVTERICSQWHNTTYDDSTLFRSLNLTDSDILMYKNLGSVNRSGSSFDLNNFYLGASDRVIVEPTIRDGLVVLPHQTGVKLVVGAPTLSRNQVVTIPKTMAVEVEIGCLSVGVLGQHVSTSLGGGYDWFIPDSVYKPAQRSKFSGPDYLFEPLQAAADAVRTLVRPAFNASIVDTNSGSYIRSINESSFIFTWPTQINSWHPKNGSFSSSGDTTNASLTILRDCSDLVHKATNASIPSDPVRERPEACGFYQLGGSWADEGSIYLGYVPMVCATATAINMVSAKLEMDDDGRITGQLSRIPSDLNIVRANYFNVFKNRNNDTVWGNYGQVQRYSLSDNPGGDLQHYIYQQHSYSSLGYLTQGSGSPGYALSQVGGAMVDAGNLESIATALIIDPTFFSLTSRIESTVATVTKWAGGYGASYLLATFSMNGFAALDKQVRVQSTGGRPAVCYKTPYVVGFIPLVLAAFAVIVWTLRMLVSSALRDTKKWEKKYGGLVPVKSPDAHSLDTVLVWDETDTRPHLRSAKDTNNDADSELTMKLISPSSSHLPIQHY